MHFNPRSREGSDGWIPKCNQPVAISIHAPAKGATESDFEAGLDLIDFNPRSREGSDDVYVCCFGKGIEFQSTLPRRERRLSCVGRVSYRRFQSTLPRRERLPGMATARRIITISIHAPAKGATLRCAYADRTKKFQSTLPRRERLCCHLHIRHCLCISMHAPAKGATYFLMQNGAIPEFQSTLPRRERRLMVAPYSQSCGFQSTLPRRERLMRRRSEMVQEYFNPRSREGSDSIY